MAECYDFFANVAPGGSASNAGLLWLAATSTMDFTLVELEITMDGGSTQYWPYFQWQIWSGAFTAPTGGSVLTINKASAQSQSRAAVTTGKYGTFTASPTGGTSITRNKVFYCNQSGEHVQWPLGREPYYCPVSGGLFLMITTPASFANNIAIYGIIEE
jgi:hypothetical protein